ncbi:MAG: hypothetical protein AUG82_07340 [Ktedonobacter sp. 13_1_20CM_4_53_11]|nr:MAG: hypothetical protein AUG82_07340 [Ktedonobacter sp. 13_1_20CM_4_53_11]
MTLSNVLLSILWLALITYTVLGGADFGAGMLELFAVGPSGARQDALIVDSMDPVWEANHVWLIFLLVVFFTAFPPAFADINVILFIPLMLAVIGIVLRGAAFAFKVHGIIERSQVARILSRIFSVASAMTPFFLAVAAAAIASGHIQIQGKNLQTNTGSDWLTPFALTIGAMALTLCVTIAAIYLPAPGAIGGIVSLERDAGSRDPPGHCDRAHRVGSGCGVVVQALRVGTNFDRRRSGILAFDVGGVTIPLSDPPGCAGAKRGQPPEHAGALADWHYYRPAHCCALTLVYVLRL